MQIFEECRVGNVNLRNRLVRSATHDGLADDGGPSEELVRKYAFMAKNDVGCIIAGYAIVSKEGSSSYPRCLDFFSDGLAEKYKRLTSEVHKYGAPNWRIADGRLRVRSSQPKRLRLAQKDICFIPIKPRL